MTFQERWAEGPPVGEPPLDLLTPEQMQKELTAANAAAAREADPDMQMAYLRIARICQDYLTLWDRNKELEAASLDHIEACDCCAGTGKPISGKPCICGGTGTIVGELAGFRARVLELEDFASCSCWDREIK